MESKVCMNVVCGAASSKEWKRGWALRSGELAILCDKCGLAFEKMTFCDTFHSNDSGWRKCASCSKRLHCGCIASRSVLELLDIGGVNCISCARNFGLHSITTDQKLKEFGTLTVNQVGGLQPSSLDHQNDCHSVIKLKPMQLDDNSDCFGLNNLIQSHNKDANGACASLKEEKEEIGSTCFQILNQGCSIELSQTSKPDIYSKHVYEPPVQTNLSITLGASLGNSNHIPSVVGELREQNKATSPFQQGPRSRLLLPKPPNPVIVTGLEQNIGRPPQIRVARPPAEGRGRNQLLPRYWPRITDQELQQISGDSNSTIVPLFEKVLSASDAGRIGRLVLPKACAEAYFPPISQPEGLPLRIQDVKGKEWVFQFRFWPNNNSRMYVLEGVTPCIQSMQLQAGDTVTFSRMDPEGKLVMGFRKAANSIVMQEAQPSVITNGTCSNENFLSSVMENLPIVSGYPSLLQSLKGSTDAHLNSLSKRMNSTSGEVGLLKTEALGGRIGEGLLLPPMVVSERKKSRNIGSKSKRLLIDSQEALELRLTWEEAQDLLRPPPSVTPSVVTIEDHEVEEYEEPPVFGKRSIFTIQSSGGQEQWVQCDSCFKWRRLPMDILLPSRWTCTDNTWDQSRCSCSAPDELSPRELENLLRLNREFKRQRIATSQRPTREHESSGLDALANAAVLGENASAPDAMSVAATTKHPRHRPGCSCIVCIQPPSGKGKHKPTCDCNVCMTVKRRFKTLMLRKKKRQSDREAEIAMRSRNTWGSKDETELGNAPQHVSSHKESSEKEGKLANDLESGAQCSNQPDPADEPEKGQIDLNCHPGREEDPKVVANRVSMMSLLQVASHPLESYLKQSGLTSFISEQQACSGVLQATKEGQEESSLASTVPVRQNGGDGGGCHQPDQNQNDPA